MSRKGNRILSYIDYLGHEQVCPIDRIGETHLHGFDATEPGTLRQGNRVSPVAQYARNAR